MDISSTDNKFGEAVRAGRAIRGYKQKELAECCGVCVATISLIESEGDTHRTPHFHTAVKIGRTLGIPIAEVVLRWAYELVDNPCEREELEEALRSVKVASTLRELLSNS